MARRTVAQSSFMRGTTSSKLPMCGDCKVSTSSRTSTSGAVSLARQASWVLTIADDERQLARHGVLRVSDRLAHSLNQIFDDGVGRARGILHVDHAIADLHLDLDGAIPPAAYPGLQVVHELGEHRRQDADRQRTDGQGVRRLGSRRRCPGRILADSTPNSRSSEQSCRVI